MHITGKVVHVGTFRVLRSPFETIAAETLYAGDHNLFFLTKELVNTFFDGAPPDSCKLTSF